jgi:hypothetical protein
MAMAKSLIEEDGLEHRWEGTDLVVDADRRDDAAALLEDVVAAYQPRLDEEADRTAYDLAGWPDYELDQLRAALDETGVPFEWTDDEELLVYEADEARVDELFERLDLRGPNPGIELDGEQLTTLLTALFVSAGRLADDADDADATIEGHRAILEVEQLAVPWGMDPDGWRALVADARELRRLIEDEVGGDSTVLAAGDDLLATDDEPDDDVEEGDDDDDDVEEDDLSVSEDDDDDEDDEDDEDDDATVTLFGDDAIMAVAGRLRDRLKRVL